ncbi:MAG: hypothetical protein ACOC2H_09320 [Spirochaetota bacterium]
MKTFIDFMVDEAGDQTLRRVFTGMLEKAETIDELKTFFSEKRYQVSEQECIRLVENKDKLSEERIGGVY